MTEKVVTVRRGPDMTGEEYAKAKREATKGMTVTGVTVVPGLVSGSTTYTLEKPKEKPKKTEEPPEEPPEEEVPKEEEEPPEEEEPQYTEDYLKTMTRAQLDDIAVSKGLNPKDYANKAKIAEAIRA